MKSKKTIQLVALVVLSALLIAFVIKRAGGLGTSFATMERRSAESGPAIPNAEVVMPVEVSWPIEIGRDLFAAPPSSVVEAVTVPAAPTHPQPVTPDGTLRLEAIMLGPEPNAIINGRIMCLNDSIEGFTVVSIEKRFIIVRRGSEEWRIDL